MSCKEALNGPFRVQWQGAMNEEIDALQENAVFEEVILPVGRKALPMKWVYRLKRDEVGNVSRFKARVVAKGFMQREGVDFGELYAPVSKHTTLRALLSTAAARGYFVSQVDVKTAFLNGELDEEIFVEVPEGVSAQKPGAVWKLRMALYGLKQAPRQWHKRLSEKLLSMGFRVSDADPSLFIRGSGEKVVYVLVYVDDMLVVSASKSDGDVVKEELKTSFQITESDDVSMFIGVHVKHDREAGVVRLSQQRYAEEVLERFGMSKAATRRAPIGVHDVFKKGDDVTSEPYAALVGSLMYLAVCTRPDLMQVVGVLARHMAAPTSQHWSYAKGVLKYLKGTISLGLEYRADGGGLVGFCDADFAGDLDTRRSTSGYVFLLHGGAISWSSKRQSTVALSTAEAEYMSASHAVREAVWLRKLMSDLGYGVLRVPVWCDSQSALAMIDGPALSQRAKHIAVHYHFLRDRSASGDVGFEYVQSQSMVADSLTKAVDVPKFEFCREHMGMS